MDFNLRGRSDITNFEDTQLILKLANVTPKDIFCDLGCGNANVCRWASKKVNFVYGVEEYKKRYQTAISNIKKYRCTNVKILNESYCKISTLKKLRKGTIFYCTNDESLGFFKKLETTVKPKSRLVTYYLPPYPIKPDNFDDWFYVMTTPFSIAKSKQDWIKSVTRKGTLNGLIKEIKRDFEDYKEKICDLEESFLTVDLISKTKT